jgi:two-component system nitrogen regulation sensor histidine kinase NtrY
MGLNKHLIALFTRILLLVLVQVGLAYSVVIASLWYTPIALFLIVVFLTIELWRFTNRTNDNLDRFLRSIQSQDFTVGFNQKVLTPSEGRLQQAFRLILDTIQNSEISRQAQYLYLQGIVEHIPTGVIAVNENDRIDLINPEARALLNTSSYTSLKNIKSEKSGAIAEILALQHGDSRLIELPREEGKKYLSVSMYSFKLLDDHIRLFTLKDIANEIDQKELEAWIKLTRVLTHEIMNSVTPLLSLTETMIMVLSKPNGDAKNLNELTNENITDIVESLATIKLRSKGLLQFVDDYRKLSKNNTLQIEKLVAHELIRTVNILVKTELKNADIKLIEPEIDISILVSVDRRSIEQVFINLLTNSRQALEGVKGGVIEWKIIQIGQWVDFIIEDNGCGIDNNKLDQIFIPFYSTKNEGSGIGLSLSRQMIHRHQGSMQVSSEKGKYTRIIVRLPIKKENK